MIKAVIFDMDGLLIDSEPLWWRANRAAFKTVGIELSDERLHHNAGRRINENIELLYHEQPWQGPSQKDIETMVVDELIASIKREGKSRPGVRQTLDLCKSQSLPLALASSSSDEIIEAVLDKLDIRNYFDLTYSAEHEPYGKPHPGIFITTADLLKTPVHNCLVFEDSPAGVLAAKAAKMACIAVPVPATRNHPFVQTADLIIDSLEEFDGKTLTNLSQHAQ